jgi:hypothetical protein
MTLILSYRLVQSSADDDAEFELVLENWALDCNDERIISELASRSDIVIYKEGRQLGSSCGKGDLGFIG